MIFIVCIKFWLNGYLTHFLHCLKICLNLKKMDERRENNLEIRENIERLRGSLENFVTK